MRAKEIQEQEELEFEIERGEMEMQKQNLERNLRRRKLEMQKKILHARSQAAKAAVVAQHASEIGSQVVSDILREFRNFPPSGEPTPRISIATFAKQTSNRTTQANNPVVAKHIIKS